MSSATVQVPSPHGTSTVTVWKATETLIQQQSMAELCQREQYTTGIHFSATPLTGVNSNRNGTRKLTENGYNEYIKTITPTQVCYRFRSFHVSISLCGSLNINSFWYSFRNWVERDSSKNKEYTRFTSSTVTSTPYREDGGVVTLRGEGYNTDKPFSFDKLNLQP